MFKIIKNSFNIIKNNPILALFFIVFLILVSIFTKNLVGLQESPLYLFSFVLILLFNSAFFSGWFGMIKKAIELSDNENTTEDTAELRLQNLIALKNEFFGSISSYILPVFAIIILYYILFLLWLLLNFKFATHFIGSIDFLLPDVQLISQNPDLTMQYLLNLPQDKLFVLYAWQLWFMLAISIFGFFTIFLPPALFFEKNNSKNPLLAFLNAFLAFFKRPLGVIGFNIFIALLFFILMITANVTMQNEILSFLNLFFTIYALVFVLVLLFNYYDKRFTKPKDNGDNGSFCDGENETCDIKSDKE